MGVPRHRHRGALGGTDPRDPAVAFASYEQAIRLDPQGAQGYASRAPLRREQGDNAGALEDWTQVIHLEPRAGEAYNSRGLIRAEGGDLVGAIDRQVEPVELVEDVLDPVVLVQPPVPVGLAQPDAGEEAQSPSGGILRRPRCGAHLAG